MQLEISSEISSINKFNVFDSSSQLASHLFKVEKHFDEIVERVIPLLKTFLTIPSSKMGTITVKFLFLFFYL